jgi:hypothetical protein
LPSFPIKFSSRAGGSARYSGWRARPSRRQWLIAAAILVHAFARPGADPAAIEAQVNSAVTKAVAVIEARHEQEAAEMNAAYDLLNKQFRQVYNRLQDSHCNEKSIFRSSSSLSPHCQRLRNRRA